MTRGRVVRPDPEAPSLPVVEDRAEDAWRVELRNTVPVDRPVHPRECDRVHVADHAVVLDWLVANHRSFASTILRMRQFGKE